MLLNNTTQTHSVNVSVQATKMVVSIVIVMPQTFYKTGIIRFSHMELRKSNSNKSLYVNMRCAENKFMTMKYTIKTDAVPCFQASISSGSLLYNRLKNTFFC